MSLNSNWLIFLIVQFIGNINELDFVKFLQIFTNGSLFSQLKHLLY